MAQKDDLIRDRDYVDAELVRLNEKAGTPEGLTEDEHRSAEEGLAYVDRAEKDIERLERLERAATRTRPVPAGPGGAPNLNRNDDPFDLSTLSAFATRAEVHGRAVTAIERVRGIDDTSRAAATALLERIDGNGSLARHMLGTGTDTYRSAFQKIIAGQGIMLTEAERTAVEAARALSLTDAAGGYAVPFTLDPTVISTKSTTTNPIRRIARNVTTLTDQWQGVTSAGMTVSWDGEAAQVSDDSPALGQAPIPVHKAQGFAVGSIEILADWASAEQELRTMFVESKDDADAIAFTTGTGSAQPTGIVTALAASAPTVLILPATAETFALADIYAMENALPAKYRLSTMDGDVQSSRASWLAARAIYNRTRQFDTNGGAALWQQLGGGLPAQLLGYATYEASGMDGTFDPAATSAHNYLLILGDFRYYVVVDRVGMTVEFVPHVFGANQRPTGQRGWYASWRVGADSVNDDAFRMLDIPTTA